jgi:predicted transcriptional regulator
MSTTDTTLTPKEDVLQLLESLPDTATWDEIEYAIYVRHKVRQGLEDIAAGRVLSSEEVRRQMQKWLDQ